MIFLAREGPASFEFTLNKGFQAGYYEKEDACSGVLFYSVANFFLRPARR